jgi:hypothetical protein
LPSYVPGVSIDDLLSTGGTGLRGAFAYIDFEPSEVEDCFKKLLRYSPPIIKQLSDDMKQKNETQRERYVIANSLLEEYFSDLYVGVFSGIQNQMELTWRYVRWPYPKSGEAGWYMSLYGVKRVFRFANTLIRERNESTATETENRVQFIRVQNEYIRTWHNYAIHYYKKIMGKKYKDIRKEYREIIDPIIEIVYPKFLRELHKKRGII